MNKFVGTAILFLFFGSFSQLSGQWAITIGGTSDDEAHSVFQTKEGDYLITGRTDSFGDKKGNFWILKLDKNGTVIWQKTIDGGGIDSASSIQETQDGHLIAVGNTTPTGRSDSQIWVLHLTKNGNPFWQRTYGGTAIDSAASVQETIDGGFLIAGTTSSAGAGSSDIWIFKLSHTGDMVWGITYGGTAEEEAFSLQATMDGGSIVVGRTTSYGAGASDIWILKLTSEGLVDWQRTYGGTKDDIGYSIQETADGGFIVAGSTQSFGSGDLDFFVIKMSDHGKVQWQKAFGGTSTDIGYSVCRAKDGGYLIAGKSNSFGTEIHEGRIPPSELSDILILKLDAGGTVQWQKTYGGNYSFDEARSIVPTASGGYIAAGTTNSWGASFSHEFFVLKLRSDGSIGPHFPFIKHPSVTVTTTTLTKKTPIIEPIDASAEHRDTNVSTHWTHADKYALGTSKCVLYIKAPSNGTVDPAPGSHTYATGTRVTLNATPAVDDYLFDEWSGNIICSINPVTIVMDGNKSIAVSFYSFEWGGGDDGGGGEWGGDSGSGCFIATSVYGSAEHSHVRILRNFRDAFLSHNKLGRRMIKYYYKHSPAVAAFVSKHKTLRITGRMVFLPIVAISLSAVKLGLVPTAIALTMIFGLPIFFILQMRKKKKATKMKIARPNNSA